MKHPDTLEIAKLAADAVLPTRAHPDDAGLDLYALGEVTLEPGKSAVVPTGIAMQIPEGFVGLVADRSSLARKGVKTAGGVIDAGYRGEVGAVLWNISREPVTLGRGDRVAQLLIVPIATPAVKEVKALSESKRGKKGFGSTGR
ncbi:MAG: dUTP diphosphatase [Elusimicrobia bacterium]|nr:dUTP diphosphatase [Elusimicrobiota bacterium]